MGANQQTSVPAFTAGQVLTAQQQTEINTGIPVFADSTARTAAFGGTGEKVLAEGQYSYLESDNTTYVYDGSSWITVGAAGLVLISSTTIGSAVSSVTVTGAFSATYENYYITVSGGVSSTLAALRLKIGAATTAYYGGAINVNYSTNAVTGLADNNAAQFSYVGWADTNAMNAQIFVSSPNVTARTHVWSGLYNTGTTAGNYRGLLGDNNAYTDFTISPSTGTLTGGNIRVYGYKN